MKKIALTKNRFSLVDDEDFEYLSKFKWHAVNNHGKYYARTAKKVNGKVKCTFMHRLLIDCPPGLEIDHTDRNPLNNQKSNLRVVTHQENVLNREKAKISPYCNKCHIRLRDYNSYCKQCWAEYQRNYRNTDAWRAHEREYKRNYRKKVA